METPQHEHRRRFDQELFDDDDEDWQQKAPVTTSEDSINRAAALDGLKLRVQSQSFRGGYITAVLSGVMLDLRDAALCPEGATISVQSALSGIEILVPADWNVVCEVDGVWSGVDESRAPARRPGNGQGPRLTVKGMVVAGGLRLR